MLKQKRPVFDFEYFFNNPKGPQVFIERFLWIKTKSGGKRPFFLNNVQKLILDDLVKLYWKPFKTRTGKIRYRFEGIREVWLKSRQWGGSTLICAIYFYDTIVNAGTNTAIYCQDDDSSKEMLDKYKLYYSEMPEQCKPTVANNNETELVFGLLKSQVSSETPGSSKKTAKKKGRSKTLRNVHASEFAVWADSKTTMKGLMKTVPKKGNVIIESTAEEVGDDFHGRYQRGKDPRSRWHSRFFPWYLFTENRVKSKAEIDFWLQNPLSEEEKRVITLYKLDNGQLAWRRQEIDAADGDIKAFLKEEPEDDVSCFESAAEIFFPEPVRKLNLIKIPGPKLGHIYCTGSDIGGGGSHSDDSTFQIIDWFTREQVYAENRIMPPEEFIQYLHDEIWCQYPGLVGIESNDGAKDRNGQGVGLTAILKAYSYEDWEPFLFSNCPRGGWLTSEATKRPTLSMLKQELMGVAQGKPGLLLSSEQVKREMNWFQELGKGKLGAPNRTTEHRNDPNKRLTDDSIIALMIAYGILPYVDQALIDLFKERFILPELKKDPKIFMNDQKVIEFFRLPKVA